MISTATVCPTVKQVRRIARLLVGHGDEEVKITFHRSGWIRVTVWDADESRSGTRYLIGPRGTVTNEERV